MVEHAPLQHVYIFFDTATFDEIERDVKVMLHVRHYFQQQKTKNILAMPGFWEHLAKHSLPNFTLLFQ